MNESLIALAKDHLNLNLEAATAALFERYLALIVAWNQRMNLTSITAPEQIRVKHFLDSLSLLNLPDLPDQARVMDVGSGAGLPGIPLQILRPKWQVVLLEATGKKVDFLQAALKDLGLEQARAVKMRAEEAGQAPTHRAQYDLVVARAVARLPILVELLLPVCKVGGLCIAMKGATAPTEISDAAYALKLLGGEVIHTLPIALPEIETPHYLISIRKVRATPAAYPRRAGLPHKSPLQATPPKPAHP